MEYIASTEGERLLDIKNMEQSRITFLSYVKRIEIIENKELDEHYNTFIKELKNVGFYSGKTPKPVRDLYFSVYNKEGDLKKL